MLKVPFKYGLLLRPQSCAEGEHAGRHSRNAPDDVVKELSRRMLRSNVAKKRRRIQSTGRFVDIFCVDNLANMQ
jgi:hypothetical protein